jgi:2-polyprenyl-3-methyl-5-hydroxy-6-metoxy-1,4-benzoquinol methylase
MPVQDHMTDQSGVKLAEREFHDQIYAQSPVEQLPATATEFLEFFRRVHLAPFYEGGWSYWGDARAEAFGLLGDVRGKRILDFGCGAGQAGVYLALLGAEIWGFDLAPIGVQRAQELAQRYGVGANTRFQCLDASALTYGSEFFDIVLGIGVLHHVIKYPQVAENTARILKPGGRAYFVETLWDNPLINLARRFSSLEKAAGDAPLTQRAIKSFARPFAGVTMRKRHLLYMLKRLAKLPAFDRDLPLKPRRLWKACFGLDQVLLKISPLRYLCGEVIVELMK